MNIKLIKGSCEYKTQIIDMLEEWTDFNSNVGYLQEWL